MAAIRLLNFIKLMNQIIILWTIIKQSVSAIKSKVLTKELKATTALVDFLCLGGLVFLYELYLCVR